MMSAHLQNQVYDIRGDRMAWRDWLWLIFCALQIPINIALAVIRAETHNADKFFWSPVNIFITQLLTLGVFIYYRSVLQALP